MDVHRNVESERSLCFELAAAAFATNQIDLERYEAVAGEIAVADNLAILQVIRGTLPEVSQPPQPPPQQVNAQASNVKKQGRWLDSNRVSVHSKHSNITLDFTEYSSEYNLRIDLELDCTSTNLRVVVPRNIDVIERISSNRMSVFRDKRRPSGTNNAVVVTGSVSSTKIKIKRKKARY